MRGEDAIAEILKREGVEFIACYPRQNLIEACAKIGIRPIVCRQERVGMAISDGFSRTKNGRPVGVFTMQHGPGMAYAFPGAAQAYADNVPLLIITTGQAAARRGNPPTFSPVDNYAHVTKWRAEVNIIERIPELFRRAFFELKTGRPGPVLMEIPPEVAAGELATLDYEAVKGARFGPDPDDVRAVARALASSEHPVIHAGQGVLYAEATPELVELAELLQAPVMTTLPGKSGFPENHPLALGASTGASTKQTAHFLNKSDVILSIGSSLTRTPYGRTLPNGKTIIHCALDPRDVHKDYRAAHVLLGDARLTLRALIDAIGHVGIDAGRRGNAQVQEELFNVRQSWREEWMGQLTSDEVPINQYRIIQDLMDTVDRDKVILTHDAGSPRDQIVPFWETTVPRSYMGWGKTTQLGYGLGLTMGAKLAEPDKLCINVMGDAAIGMVGLDIETAVRNRIGILTIVFNNQVMAIETDAMPHANEHYGAYEEGGDWAAVAKALGAWSHTVERPDDFKGVLADAIEVTRSGQPALIDCHVKRGYDFSRYA